jgi:hypothetical protein
MSASLVSTGVVNDENHPFYAHDMPIRLPARAVRLSVLVNALPLVALSCASF